METNSADRRMRTWVSDDGKPAAAGMSLGPVGTKPGGGGEEQPYDGHGRYLGSTGLGGLSGGSEVRGKVTPPHHEAPTRKVPSSVTWKGDEGGKPTLPPPPPPRQPHLTYNQKSGELTGPDGKSLIVGHAGRGGGQNNPEAEGIKGVGPIPQGNWRVESIETSKWPEPSYKLTPDEQTRKRVLADMELPAELLITRWKWPKDVKAKPGGVQHFIDIWFVGGRVSAFNVWKLYDM